MSRVMALFNRLIHYFNLIFGVTLVVVLSLTMVRVYGGNFGLTDLNDSMGSSHSSSSFSAQKRIPTQEEVNEELPSSSSLPGTQTQEISSEDTAILGNVGLNSEQMGTVATGIYHVAKGVSEEYSVSDSLTLTLYILRYMAEIGEYEMGQQDILMLIGAFENLAEMEVGPEVRDIIEQIKKIRFGRKSGKLFAQIFARHPDRGVEIPINEVATESDATVEEIIKVVIAHGSEFYFEDIEKTEQMRKAKNFIKEPVKLLGGFEFLVNDLNQIHRDIPRSIDSYFMRDDLKASPLWVDMKGVSILVDTSTVFDKINFEFHSAVALPGINKVGSGIASVIDSPEENEDLPVRIPSIVLGAKAKLLNLKVSVDQ